MSRVLDKAFGNPMKLEEDASAFLAGGILQHGYQCGMVWGSALAAGAQIYKVHGPGPESETRAIIAAQKIVEVFQDRFKHFNCLEITEISKSSSVMDMIVFFLIKGGTIHCFRMASKFAPLAYTEIDAVISEKNIESPEAPASCVSLLMKKMGASELHTMMAAGLAGGIGLCGGACGALGAAIWVHGMNTLKEPDGKIRFSDPKASEIIEKFLKAADYEFECSEIVGRKFENVKDHSDYLQNGGCAKIIDALADI
ncbi:C-GCAxxG-C-C family (seleno)protein [Bacteroidota bacterium]